MTFIPCSTDPSCAACSAAGVLKVLGSGATFRAQIADDIADVIAVRTDAIAPAGSAVQIECGDLTVLGEVAARFDETLQVQVEHVFNNRAFEHRGRAAAAQAGR
jgi:hypothetical protein